MLTLRPFAASDMRLLHDWLCRPHIAQWWGAAPSYAEVEDHYLAFTSPESSIKGYIAMLRGRAIGFGQSYVVIGSGEGWWEDEDDPGARGIDQFLANAEELNKGFGTALVRALVEHLFEDPSVTKIQTDPAPDNDRAIRCYEKAGFVAYSEVVTPDGAAVLMLRRRATPDEPR